MSARIFQSCIRISWAAAGALARRTAEWEVLTRDGPIHSRREDLWPTDGRSSTRSAKTQFWFAVICLTHNRTGVAGGHRTG